MSKKQFPSGSGKRPEPPAWHPQRAMGLARALQKAGYASRRLATEMIGAGRVQVDGEVTRDPAHPVTPQSEILLDRRPLTLLEFRYFALNKPARVVCSAADGPGRKLVSDYFPPEIPGLQAAGRLDSKTTGLLLVSNDPGWNRLATGAGHLEQEYRVQVEGMLSDPEVGVITAGVHLPNLGLFRALSVTIVEKINNRTVLLMVIREGKVRQLRRMFSTLRHSINLLRRVRIGSIRLGSLAAGGMRPLTDKEVQSVRDDSAAAAKPKAEES